MALPQLYPASHTAPGTHSLLDGPCVTLEPPLHPGIGSRAPRYPPLLPMPGISTPRRGHYIVSLFHSCNDDAVILQHPSRPSRAPHTVKLLLLVSSTRCVAVATSTYYTEARLEFHPPYKLF